MQFFRRWFSAKRKVARKKVLEDLRSNNSRRLGFENLEDRRVFALPVVTVNLGAWSSPGNNDTISADELLTLDADNTPTQLIYNVTTAPTGGNLYLSPNFVTVVNSFTQNDINQNKLVYNRTSFSTANDSFTFTVTDSTNTTASTGFNLFTPANDANLLKDINTQATTNGSAPNNFTNVSGVTFFSAVNATTGRELWRSDGTAAGTALVKDIFTGTSSSTPNYLTNVNGTLFFIASDGINGYELWKSDGTTAGTTLVKDIFAGASGSPRYLTNVGGTLFFTANDGVNGYELWKSDGTSAGTTLVKDIYPGDPTYYSFPRSLTNVNGTLYFNAYNPTNGYELWKSDGTTAGTVIVKDINSGSANSNPKQLTNVSGTLFFNANDGTNGTELWKSDGTAAGTVLVKDIYSGSTGSFSKYFTNVSGTLFFTADDGTNGTELWKSNGTTAGTVLVKDILTGGSSYAQSLTNVNGTLFFNATNGTSGYELWKSDGTTAGTSLVLDIFAGASSSTPNYLTNVNGTLFFSARTSAAGVELWKSDGTGAGTTLVKDIFTGATSSFPSYLANVAGSLFFSAADSSNGYEVWKSDGTSAGTAIVKDIYSGTNNSNPKSLTNVSGNLFFGATDTTNGTELWKSDGTTAGTALVKDISSGVSSSTPNYMTNVNGTLFFTASDSTNGNELWKSTGTAAGTVVVKDIFAGSSSSTPKYLTNVNNTLFFQAFTVANGTELWKSDGTTAGTVIVKDIIAGSAGSTPKSLVNINGTLFFTASTAANGLELWKSDGTSAGTVLVKDIVAGSTGSSPVSLTNVNGTLFFSANDSNGYELWKSDGTAAGTILVKDINSGASGSMPSYLTNVNGTLFFRATDGSNGYELWNSDGTMAGTTLVKDISAGFTNSDPKSLINVNNTLFFTATNAANGTELWKSDGSTAGTTLVKDIFLGVSSSVPSYLVSVASTLFFNASNSTNGTELWKSDGTAAGTIQVDDIANPGGSNPTNLTVAGNNLFLSATTNGEGNELWYATLQSFNTAPINTVPGTQSATEDTNLAISSVSIADVDAGSGNMLVTLNVTGGTVSLTASGAAVLGGTGTAKTITGTVTDVNATLLSLVFIPTANLNGVGAGSIQIVTNDQGNSGTGGPLTDTDTFSINIAAVNDPPVNTVPGTQSATEDTNLAISGVSISDLDAAASNVLATLNVTGGTVTVTASGSAVVGGSGIARTITGTVTDVNATLVSLVFIPTANLNGSGAGSIQIVTNDQGNTGSGGPQNDTDSISIDIAAVNDPPVNTVPGTQSTAVNTSLPISGVSIADSDAASGNLLVTLNVTGGTVSATAAGSAVLGGTGSALTITGTVVDVNATLNSLVYTPTFGLTGAGAGVIQVVTSDQGNTGSGGAQTDTDSISINVGASFNVPPVNTVPGTQSATEDTNLAISGVSISDIDAGSGNMLVTLNVAGGTVSLTASGAAVLGGTGTAKTITGTVTDVNATLVSLNFIPTADLNGVGAGSIQIVTNDQGNTGTGGPLTDTDTFNINIAAVNDPPVNTVPGTQSATEDTNLAISSVSISDVDAASGNMLVTLNITGGTVSLTASGAAVLGGTGSAKTITGTVTDVNATLTSLIFAPTANFNGSGAGSIQIVTNDQGNSGSGGALTDTDSFNINIAAVNDAPVNTIPGTQSVPEDTNLPISGVSIADIDASSGNLLVTLNVTGGTVALTASGAAVLGGTGSAKTITGTVTDVNNTLTSLVFAPTANLSGSGAGSIQVITNDQGNTGSGGAQTDTDTFSIDIAAVNDAPVNTIPATQSATEDTNLAISGVSISDIDAASGNVLVTLNVTGGTVTVTASGSAVVGGSGTARTITGTITDVNATLTSLVFAPTANLNGSGAGSIQVITNDQGNTGAPGPRSDTDTFSIDIVAVNDAPVNTVPGTQTATQNTNLAISGISISDTDAASGNLLVTLNITGGTVTVTASGSAVVGGSARARTITGTVADVNATLTSLVFAPTANLNGVGAASIQVDTNDQGNTGAPGPQSATDTFSIDIAAIVVGGVLTITDTLGVANNWVVSRVGTDIVVTDTTAQLPPVVGGTLSNGNQTLTIPAALILNGLVLNGAADDDTATLDLSTALGVPVTFNGGSHVIGDYLTINSSGSYTNVAHSFTNAQDGSVTVTGNAAISYTGSEAITDNLDAVNRTFTFTGGTETISLNADPSPGFMLIASTLGEAVSFVDPSGSLTITSLSGADTVNVDGFDPAFNADFKINAGTGTGSQVLVSSSLSQGGTNGIDITGDFIGIGAAQDLTGSGSITLTAGKNINVGDTLTANTGDIVLHSLGAAAGDYVGVNINANVTTFGDISISGTGGTDAGGFQIGVNIQTAAISGNSVSINGTGGAATGDSNSGVNVSFASISSISNNINITATGGSAGASGSNAGLVMDSATISAGGTAAVTINATGANSTGLFNDGVSLSSAGITANNGTISINGSAPANSTGVVLSALASISTGTNNAITFQTNSYSGDGTESVNSGTGTTTIRPYTPGVLIDLGSADILSGTPTLGLDDLELDAITAGTLVLGNNLSGDMTVSSDITRSAQTNVNLASGGTINLSIGSIDSAGGSVVFQADVIDTHPGNDVNATKLTTVGSVTLSSSLTLDISGNVPDTSYQQLNVVGSINLNNATLNLTGTYDPVTTPTPDIFIIVDNDGTDPIVGTFNGLLPGAKVLVGPSLTPMFISYAGNDGNDVVLTAFEDTAPILYTQVTSSPLVESKASLVTLTRNENTTPLTPATLTTFRVDDPDIAAVGDNITYSLLPDPDSDYLAFDIITNTLTNTATLKFKATYGDFETPRDSDNNNTYDIFVIATDSAGLTSTQLVSISVQNVNEAPVFTTTDSDLRRLENFNTTLVESEARETNTVDPNADTYVLDKTTNDDPTQFNGRLEIRVRDEDNENLLGSTDAAPVIATVTQTLLFQIVLPSALNPTAGADGALFTISNATGVTIPTYDALAPYSPTLNQFGVLQFVGKFDGKDSDDPLDADGKGDFQVTVRVTDGNGGQVDKLYTIQIIKQDDNAPVFDSTTVHHTVENTTGAIDGDNNNIFDAHDDDLAWPMAAGAAANIVPYETLTYTITGGADQTKFALSGTNNSAINFNTAPDFETKASAATSNDYDLIVTVTDGHTGAASLALGSADVPQTLVISVRPNNDNSPVFNTLTETSFNGATGSTVTVNNASYTIGGGVAALRSDENQLNIATLTGSDADKNLGSATNVSRVTVATFNAGTIYTLTLGTGTSVSVTGQADRNATAAALVAAWNANITASGVYTASNLGATITFTGGSAISKGTITTSVSGTAGGTFSAVSASSSQLNYSIDATNLSGPDAKYFDIVTNNAVTGTATLTWKNKMDFETKQDANNDGVYTVVLKVADDSGETEDTGITTTDTNEGFHLLTVNVTVISQNDAPIITSNGGGATADVTVNESVGGASVLVTNVVATDQEVTAGSQVLSYSIVAGGDGSAFTINKNTGALTFKNNPDYENPTDSDHNNTYVVTVRASDSLGAKDDQVITVTVANISLVTGGIALGSSGGIELNDAASADNHYLISRDGNYLRIQDLDTTNPDSALQVSGVEMLGAQSLKSDGVTVVSTLTAGNTSVSGKIVRILYSSFDATKKPFIISTKLGNDQVDIDTTGSKLPSPSFGLTLDFGSGNDTLTLVNNASFNVWDLTSAQGGSVAVGPAGSFKFDNLENITGGSAADNFNLKMVGTESFGVLDGGAGLNTVTVSRAFGTKYTLDDALNYTDATATLGTVVGVGSLKVNPTVLTNAPKDQTWSIKNIQRANITGSNQNDTYNLDKWNQQGDNTLANNYGGLLLAGGGIDVLQKSGAMTYVGISDIEVSVTPDVTTGFAPEVQKIVIAGTPISGTYAIVTGAGTTAPIAFNANAATVQAAIRAIGGGTVFPSVTVASTGTGTNLTHTITLTGVTSDVPQFTVDNSLLVGSGTEVQRLTIAGTPTAGNYTITTPAGTTGNIPFNSNAATVQAALQLLPGYGAVTVSSSGTAPNFTHDITFTGVTGNITQLTVNSAGVTGGTFTPSTLTQGGTTTFTPSTVYQAGLHMRTAGNIQPTIVDTSAAVATTVNVTGLSRNNAKFTAAGNLDANKIALDGNWFKATLDNASLSVNTYFPFALTGFNSSAITGAGNDQALTYKNFGWSATGTNSFDGGAGLDSIRATRDTDFTITDSSVAIGSFNASLLNNSIENFTWNTGAPTATTANTVTLSGWSGIGNANAGAGSDTLVVSKAASATNLNLNLTPQAIGVGVVGSPSFKTVGLNSSFETANITSGTGTDIITLSNWNGDATVNGTSNTTGVDTLNIQRDSGHKLETGKDTLGTGKVINYSNIDALNVTGGASANTFELLSGYDTNLTAGSANFVLKPSGGLDTLKLTSLGVSPVVTGGTTPNVVLGGRTLDLKVGGSPDLFENVAFKGAVAADTLTFTNYTGKATIDGAKSLTVNNDANYIVNAAKLTVGGSIYDIPATGAGIGADGIILVAGTSANSFTVDGWAGKLDLNAGSGTAVDALVYTSPDLSITLTDATVTSAARATAVVLNSSFETATLNGTAAASVGQNFIVTGWSNGGRISADVSPQANTKGTALDDAKNDSITIGSTSTAKDVDYVLNASSLKYGPGTPPGSGPGASAKTWNFSNIDQVRIDLDNVANTNNNYIDASGYNGFTYIDGGPGDDVIRGGFGVDDLNGSAGNDMLVGGEGNDKIDGDAGNDVVIGGDGIDSLDTRLNGSVGNDLVITGRTTFDNTKAALDLILAAWGSQTGGSAGAAKAALESGVGTVGSTTVKLVVGSSPTVLDDALVDVFTELATPGEDDWIFFQGNGTGDENGAGLPTDLPTNFELATDLK